MAKKRAPTKAGATRKPNGQFVEGVSGNPGGRPKGLAELIRAKSKDGNGDELVDWAFDVMRGKPAGADLERARELGFDLVKGLEDQLGIAPMKVRAEVWKHLLDHLHGKPAQAVQVTGKDGGPIKSETKAVAEDVDPDRLSRIARVLQEIGALPSGVAGAGEAAQPADDGVHLAPAAPAPGGVPSS